MRKITLLSVLLALCLVLTSCGFFGTSHKVKLPYSPSADDIKEIETPETVLPSPPSKPDFGIADVFDPEKALSELYPYDYNYGFVTVASTHESCALSAKTESFIDSCVYKRNEALEGKLLFTFSFLNENISTVVKNVERAQKNKTKYADIVAVSLSEVSSFDSKDILCPTSSLAFVTTGENYAINNQTFALESDYFIANEASILPSRTRVVYFNSSLLETSGKDLPYSRLSSKSWTWDLLADYLSAKYPLATSDDITKLIKATVKTESTDKDELKAIDEAIKTLSDDIAAHTVKDDPKAKFLAGEALFYLGTLADITDISSSEIVCGVMPIPVFNEGDDYSDIHDAKNITVYACPKSSSDIDHSAFLIAALGETSVGSRANAFSQILDNKLLRDNGSRLSLGYIFTADIEIIY